MSNPNPMHDPENVKEEDIDTAMDDNSDKVVEAEKAADEHFSRERDSFGGGGGF